MRAGPAVQRGRAVWRGAPRRWRQVIMVAAALALPGGIAAGASAGMLPTGSDGTSEVIDGILAAAQQETALGGFLEPEHLSAVPVGASSVAEPVRAVLAGDEVIEVLGENGIPTVAVDAYMQAADQLAVDDPECGIRWTLLAAIGRVESNHGRFGGAQLRDDGYGTRPIWGIPLDGRPDVALIRDTDGGRLDGDTTYDRAVGPMQFIPSTWQSVGVDADGDGRRDPNNIFDAAQGAAVYLCRGDADLREAGGQAGAVRRYNNADRYVRVVLDLAASYDSGEVDLLPSIGLPSREPTPPPRPTPAPPRTAPDPEMPLASDRRVTPAPPPAADAPTPVPPAPRRPRDHRTLIRPRRLHRRTPRTRRRCHRRRRPRRHLPRPRPCPLSRRRRAPDDTIPPTTSTTAPGEPPAGTGEDAAPSPSDPGAIEPPAEAPAAVGWAPAMREVVVEIIEGATDEPAPAEPTEPTTAPALPQGDPPPGAQAAPSGRERSG